MKIVHTPVLKEQTLEYLIPQIEHPLMIDCTLGEGGHTSLFLEKYPFLHVIGLDRDVNIQKVAIERLEPYKDRFTAVNAWFDEFLLQYQGDAPSIILFDLGISVFHYEESLRGFSFSRNENLDMRLNVDKDISAADIVNTYSEQDIAHIIFTYGEERYGRKIARAICKARDENPITKSDELASIISSSVPPQYRHQRIHPATRTFQALRIAVNSELDRIIPSIHRAIDILAPGGYIGVISFHSLEDRPVKHLFREREKGCICPPKAPICTCGKESDIKIITRKPLIASDEECRINPPSRSAKFRVAQKKGGSV
jgi:16S rRNA (cytosine1402-N4)-methyltransferase